MALTSCDKEEENNDAPKTALEGKWSISSREEYDNNGYAVNTESFAFNGNQFVLESSEVGVNPQGDSWGYGHKLTGTFTLSEADGTFTIKVEKFYGFNNDDEQFDWHEYEEASVGQSYTFNYVIRDGKSLGVTVPEDFALGGGSSLYGGQQVWFTK